MNGKLCPLGDNERECDLGQLYFQLGFFFLMPKTGDQKAAQPMLLTVTYEHAHCQLTRSQGARNVRTQSTANVPRNYSMITKCATRANQMSGGIYDFWSGKLCKPAGNAYRAPLAYRIQHSVGTASRHVDILNVLRKGLSAALRSRGR